MYIDRLSIRYFFLSLLILPFTAIGDNLVTNGSFEQTNPIVNNNSQINVPSNSIENWAIVNSSIDYLNNPVPVECQQFCTAPVGVGSVDYVGTYWNQISGNYSLDLSGCSAGAIEQNVATTIGESYVVTFNLAGHPTVLPIVKTLQVTAGTKQSIFTFDTANTTLTEMGWETHSFSIVADSSSTTLRFESLDNSCGGPVIDNVVVRDTKLALLVKDRSSLDADETHIRTFLINEAIGFELVDAQDILNGKDLSIYKAFYMRTGSEPLGFSNAIVSSAIDQAVQDGAHLILEYYGLYLGEYIGLGTIETRSWGPVVLDAGYFVQKDSVDPLLNNVADWPSADVAQGNNPDQLIVQLTKTGGKSFPRLHLTVPVEPVDAWLLTDTPGWFGQSTNYGWCIENPGICNASRTVFNFNEILSTPPESRGISYAQHGKGRVLRLELSFINSVSVTQADMGPVIFTVRKNAIEEGILSEPIPELSVVKTGNGNGRVYSTDGKIDCGTTCANQIENSVITLVAQADSDSTLVGWSYQGCAPEQLTCDVTLDSNINLIVEAIFTKKALAEDPKIVFIGICGAGRSNTECAVNEGWFDPRNVYPIGLVNPFNQRELELLGTNKSGVIASGLRVGRQFPDSIVNIAAFASETVLVPDVVQVGFIYKYLIKPFYNSGDKVVIMGHSFGGIIAIKLMSKLKRKGIPIQMIGFIDATQGLDTSRKIRVKENVERAFNFYYTPPQEDECKNLLDYGLDYGVVGISKIKLSKKANGIISNQKIDNPKGLSIGQCAGHRNMDNDSNVWGPMIDYILSTNTN